MSTLSIFPKVRPWKVTTVPTRSKLMLAVKGFAKVKVAEAIPVSTMSIGNDSDVLCTNVWWIAGMVTGLSRICERADFNEPMVVEPVSPEIAVSESTP